MNSLLTTETKLSHVSKVSRSGGFILAGTENTEIRNEHKIQKYLKLENL